MAAKKNVAKVEQVEKPEAAENGNGGKFSTLGGSYRKLAYAAVAEIDGDTSLSELVAEAGRQAVEAGGESRPKLVEHHVRRALEVAEALGVLRLTRPTDILVSRAKR